MTPRTSPKPGRIARRIALVGCAVLALWLITVVLVYAQSPEGKLSWGADYASWPLAGGFVLSPSHDGRFYRVFANTREAARVYRRNGERLRYFDGEGTQDFPLGSVLAMESYERTPDNAVGARGPVFFLKKEDAAYDPEGGNWRYAMTDPDLKVLAEGKDKNVTQCRACHAQAKARDYVFAKDR